MTRLVSCITEQHHWPLLLVAACVCAVGNLAGVFMLSRAHQCAKAHRDLWLAVAGVVLGGTIWATHFIAMLAYSIPVNYQIAETGISIVAAIAIACLATYTLLHLPGRQGAVAAGMFLGLAIAVMHAIGLSAISSVYIENDTATAVMAWLLGGGFSISATLLFYREMNGLRLILASFFIVLAVCSHHMVSMTGLAIVPLYPGPVDALTFLDRVGIATGVCIVSSLLIATGVAALFFDRHLTDVKGLANATSEAVVLTRAGQIVHANERFTSLTGKPIAELKSASLSDFMFERQGSRGLLNSPCGPIHVEIVEGVIEYKGRETSVFGLRDISERLEANRQLMHLAAHDPLTGLLNRRAFNSRSEEVIADAVAGGKAFSLLTLDLDRFKSINDVHGHATGDLILQQVADVLNSSFEGSALVGRIGGDEFSVLLPGLDGLAAHQSASVLIGKFRSQFETHEKAGALGVSVGVATFPEHGADLKQLQNNADAALYRAKSQGRGRICAFDRFLDQQLQKRRRLEDELRGAVNKGELFLLYQPIVETVTREHKGYEALLRWRHPTLGVLSPAVFIEAAEESGSIVEIGKWVLDKACREASSWDGNQFVAINVSVRQLYSSDLVDHVATALSASGLPPERLELEITETSLLEDSTDVAHCLDTLDALGVKLVMDDYGSGYASMTNLRRYPFHKVKIDRSYVAALEDDPVAEVSIDCALALGKVLGLAVVVEGVETETQYHRLIDKMPNQLQGFLFGRPAQIGDHLRSENRRADRLPCSA
ncbi:diguanylate cyclase (GGDEF)-like protein [Neorhizobium sp. 2083]|uniref:putative bifunctional diguanylate cyclase/phosphodiesterase n=1 Tax=Neorhizobium sp. 2083 TaxID=2817762 RepID=UPI00286123ED|nr:EAL domain-containing protein [Neorhizobium sp. 2083]MDR6820361.1 diguanylate cyclase (GGDEF)-like protein [Neorhizobium sp. 2083]